MWFLVFSLIFLIFVIILIPLVYIFLLYIYIYYFFSSLFAVGVSFFTLQGLLSFILHYHSAFLKNLSLFFCFFLSPMAFNNILVTSHPSLAPPSGPTSGEQASPDCCQVWPRWRGIQANSPSTTGQLVIPAHLFPVPSESHMLRVRPAQVWRQSGAGESR